MAAKWFKLYGILTTFVMFTGMDEDSGEKTVGMRLGSYATGTIGVAPVYSLPHVPDRMKDAVRVIHDRANLLQYSSSI